MFRQGAVAIVFFSLVACGGGGKSDSNAGSNGSPAAAPSITVAPAATDLDPGASTPITATVSGISSADLIWTVDNILNGDDTVGRLSGSGGSVTYTAPASEGSHLVIAATKVGTIQSGSSTLRVASSVVGVTLTPSTVTLKAGGTQSFTAGITGTTNTAVWWTVDGVTGGNATVGTVSGTGHTVIYTAPATVPVTKAHTLTVHSTADTSKGDSSTITVTASAPPPPPPAPVSVVLTPGLVSLAPGATQSFTAAVAGCTNTTVTWKVDGLSGGSASTGTISGTGNTVTYTAPVTAGSHSLTVTSVADTTKSASATATINATCAPAPTSSTTVSVKDAAYGAKGDGVTDDTAAIQKAVNAIGGTGGTVMVPDGTYMVNALTSINLKSNMTLALSSGATLKAITNSASNYAVVLLSGVNHVNVTGGTILGERSTHTGTGGEWGMGLQIKNCQSVVIERVLAKDCWGDGFCISGSSIITVCNATGDHNRRQGLTITSVDGMVVRNCTFKNTSGTLPEDGIDIEPNPGETVNNVLITGCTFTSNSGFGIEMGVPLSYAGKAWVTGVTVDGNTVTGSGVNTLSTSPRAGIEASDVPGGTVKITNNISSSNGLGIMIRDNANGFIVTGNTCSQNSSDGIQVYSTSANAITGNTATSNGRYGIYSVDNPTITISGNTLSGNAVGP